MSKDQISELARHLAWLENERAKISRRQLLKASALTGLGLASLKLAGCSSEEATSAPAAASSGEGGQVVVCSWGGHYQEAQRESMFDPFEAETGIKVIDTSTPDVAKVKAMVDSGNVEWDVVDIGLSNLYDLGEDYFEPIDYSIYSQEELDGFPEGTKLERAIGCIYLAVVAAYRTDVFPTGEHPKNWTEFWDADRFPGPRALYASGNDPKHTIEHALMADGVPMDEIYPCDIDRAFASFDKIKPHVVKWWTQGPQSVQMMADKEVALASMYSADVIELQSQDKPVAIEWTGGTMNIDMWFIVKNAPNRENAQKLVEFMTRGKVQAHMAELSAYSPVNETAFDHLDEATADTLPGNPKYASKMLRLNSEFWAENRERVQERFIEWVSG